MKTMMINIDEYANLIIVFIIMGILIGIFIEILFLTVGSNNLSSVGTEGVSQGSNREQRDSEGGEGGLGW